MNRISSILLFIVTTFCLYEVSAQQKRLYIANDDHTDYMWTADETIYDSAFVHMLDFYLDQVDSTKDNPSDFQARFNTDGSIWLKAYQKYRSAKQFDRLIAAINSGHISSPLNMLVSCYGGQPTEAVIRGMYYAGQLERKYKLRFTMAGAMENNTLPLGLASLWAGSGAKYSWKGIGGYGSQMSYEMRARRKYPMYRYTGLDGTGVLMKWYPYNEKAIPPLGGYAECRMLIKYKDLEKEIGQVINVLDSFSSGNSGYHFPYKIAAAFGFGHDDLQTLLSDPFIKAAKNATNQHRRVRVSNEEDFFRDFEKTYPVLPAQSVSYGNEWDLLPASMNETTARMRRATEKLRSAEALATLVAIRDKNFMNALSEKRNQAWESFGVYWEHNWTADGPVSRKSRADWQIKTQKNLSSYVDTLFDLSIKKLGSQLTKSAHPTFFVFNPLSWARTDVADLIYNGEYPVKIIDMISNQEASSQLIEKDGKRYIRIWAENIPSVGYKIFEIQQGAPASSKQSVLVNKEFISNRFYRLRLTKSGVITEWYDSLTNNRQLIKAINGKYVNDLGTSDVDQGEELVVENEGPVSVTFKAVSDHPIRHITRVTMFSENKRIEIENNIQQNFGDVKAWAFSFDLKDQITRHEELGAILTVKKETRGGHYAEDNARYDWQTFNHFANMSEAQYGISISNQDCSFFKLGNSTIDSLWESSSQINALAGGNVDRKIEDGGVLGILNQHGNQDFLYKFALTAHQTEFKAVDAMKFSLEHQNPLVAGMVTGTNNPTMGNSFSLMSISNPNVLLWSVKPSEDGIAGEIATRWWNIGEDVASPILAYFKPVRYAFKTSHIETNERRLPVANNKITSQMKAGQLFSLRLF